jgi:hypothetical protein
MSQSCDQWEDKLATTCVNQLSPTESEALHLHMQTCRACFNMYTEYLVIDGYLQRSFADKPVVPLVSASRLTTSTCSSQDRVAGWSFLKLWQHWLQDPSWLLVGIASLLGLLSFVLNQVISPAPGANATLALSLMLAPIGGMLFFRAISASSLSTHGVRLQRKSVQLLMHEKLSQLLTLKSMCRPYLKRGSVLFNHSLNGDG